MAKTGISLPALAAKMGIKYHTLYRLLMGQRGGTIATWEVIDRHYSRKRKK